MKLRLLCAVCGLTADLFADFDPPSWKRRQRITVAEPVTRVRLDAQVYADAAASLADLRVTRDGAEVPYLLSVAQAQMETAVVSARLMNRESRQGTLMATIEFEGRQVHNRLELEVTREDFRTKVRVEASDDGRVWAVVRAGAYVFRYKTGDGRVAEHLTIQYPDSRRRLVRLTVEEWPDAAQFTGVRVTRDTSRSARRSVLWQAASGMAVTTVKKTSCAVVDTGTAAPRDRLLVEPGAEPAVFHRSVTLEESLDGKSWSWLAAGALYRTAGDSSLAVEFSETRSPWLRVCVFQGDDAPLRFARVQVEGLDREATFRGAAAGEYWLYYGAARAAAPSYDLARTAGAEFWAAARVGALGAAEANPGYVAPAAPVLPWSDRYPVLLYAGLGVAVLGLGWMALKLLRSPGLE